MANRPGEIEKFIARRTPGGHRVFRFPTTSGNAGGQLQRAYDQWMYVDDFAMSSSETQLPTYP